MLSNNPDAAISNELFQKFEPTGCKPIYHCEEAANLMTDEVKTSRDLSSITHNGEIKIAYKHEDLVCLGSGKNNFNFPAVVNPFLQPPLF